MTDKTWGESIRRFIDSHVQLEEIKIVAGGYSSIHLHERKTNLFIVTKGELQVIVYDDDGTQTNDSMLIVADGRAYDIPPGVKHQFHALTDVEGYELYIEPNGTLDAEDIKRFTENGVDAKSIAAPDAEYVHCALCNASTNVKLMSSVTIANAERLICHACRKVREERGTTTNDDDKS